MDLEVRTARDDDRAGLAEIERGSEPLFHRLGIVFPPGPTVIEELAGTDARVLVSGDPPVGFAAVRDVDGAVHLEQIAVRADLMGRGIGVPLLRAVLVGAAEAGAPGVSLLTFRDVPWNMPWYARHGFAELPGGRWGPGLRAYRDAEIEAGLHGLGPRVVMWAPVR